MSEKDDGGSVYACAAENGHQEGISRRDWLAGLAMQCSVRNYKGMNEDLAKQSYEIADAMIAEGKK